MSYESLPHPAAALAAFLLAGLPVDPALTQAPAAQPEAPAAQPEAHGAEAPEAAPRANPPTPAGPDRSAEIARALAGLNSPVMDERVAACKSLSFSGITDTAVYDAIERNVWQRHAGLPKNRQDREAEQEIGWCAKALAYSGNDKYRPTLEKLAASHGRLSDHAEVALERLAHFARWNPIMNDWANHRPGQSWEMTRAFNMLNSGDPPLQREGLKLIKEIGGDPTPLHDLVERKLLAAHAGPFPADGQQEDIVAWYCRSLAASRNLKYRDTLRRVAADSPSKKVRTYASRALGDLAGD